MRLLIKKRKSCIYDEWKVFMQHKKQQFKGNQSDLVVVARRNGGRTGNRGKKAYINPEKFINKNVSNQRRKTTI